MPTSYIKDLSDKYDISVDKLETQWKSAKETIGDKYSDNEKAKYGAIVKVFKNMINKEFDLHESEVLTVDDSIFVVRYLNEMARPARYQTKEDIAKAIASFDSLPKAKMPSEAKSILKAAEKVGYTIKAEKILKYNKTKEDDSDPLDSLTDKHIDSLKKIVSGEDKDISFLKKNKSFTDEIKKYKQNDETSNFKTLSDIEKYAKTAKSADELYSFFKTTKGMPYNVSQEFMKKYAKNNESPNKAVENLFNTFHK